MSVCCHSLGAIMNAVKPSATLALAQQARDLKEQGITVYNFTVGEPDFDPPKAALDAAHAAIDNGYHKYTPADGLPELKQAIAAWHEKEYGFRPEPGEIVASPGAKTAIAEVLMVLLDDYSEVIITAPYWVSYPTMVKIAHGEPVIVTPDATEGYGISAKDIEAAITPKTAAILLNSPSNPSGAIIPPAEIDAIMTLAEKHDIWVITDDIYNKLVYDGIQWDSPAKRAKWRERVIVINGVSKTYAMTGWRIGWMVGPQKVARAVARLQGQLTSNPTAVAQMAAAAVLQDQQAAVEVERMRQSFENRRNLIVDLLNDVPGITCTRPKGAFYVFADVRELMSSKQFTGDTQLCSDIIEKAHVVTVPGSAFGIDGHLRFSFATDEKTITDGVRALKEYAMAE